MSESGDTFQERGEMKTLRDIKTHGNLVRAGLLIGVARVGLQRPAPEIRDGEDWDAKDHVFNKSGAICQRPRYRAAPRPLDEALVKEHLRQTVQDIFGEIEAALKEGVAVSKRFLEWLEETKARL